MRSCPMSQTCSSCAEKPTRSSSDRSWARSKIFLILTLDDGIINIYEGMMKLEDGIIPYSMMME